MKPPRLLLEGPPKIGKTTATRRLIELLREHGVAVNGFVTHEIRERDRRVGFVIHDLAGSEGVLAHQDFQTGVRVGRFGVDVPAFERVALPALRRAQETSGTVIIDELGRMELASEPFVEAVDFLLAGSSSVVATVHVYEHSVTDALKRRADVQRVAGRRALLGTGVAIEDDGFFGRWHRLHGLAEPDVGRRGIGRYAADVARIAAARATAGRWLYRAMDAWASIAQAQMVPSSACQPCSQASRQ